MIATFIYTECQSAGTFKSEPGFKVKDVNLWKVRDNKIFVDQINPENSTALESVIMETVGALPYYESPKMSPFITESEFLALEKHWVYMTVSQNYKAFVRLSSTGLSNGRRGNPFHMGIIFEKSSIQVAINYWKKASGQSQIYTPADLFNWSGWQNPRTDFELEEIKLSPNNFPTPKLLPRKRFIDDPAYLASHRAEIKTALVEMEKSANRGIPAKLAVENTWDFIKIAGIATSLLPPDLAWSTNLQSSHLQRSSSERGWQKSIVWDGNETDSVPKGSWASMAMNLLDVEGYRELEPLLAAASSGIHWKSTDTNSGLWFLPMVLMLYSATPNDFLTKEDVFEAFNVAMHYWPKDEVAFKSQSFKASVITRANQIGDLAELDKQRLIDLLDLVQVTG